VISAMLNIVAQGGVQRYDNNYKALNHDASLSSTALITSARVGGHYANPTNIVSSALEYALSSLPAAFDE
jgi:hypothetical protein